MGWLRQGVGELIRQAGLRLMDLLMQEEVRELVGERSQRQAERIGPALCVGLAGLHDSPRLGRSCAVLEKYAT